MALKELLVGSRNFSYNAECAITRGTATGGRVSVYEALRIRGLYVVRKFM